ncbi:MAG: HAMP domain-containing sensor histidine kinase [Anaerolineaceae bacterium]
MPEGKDLVSYGSLFLFVVLLAVLIFLVYKYAKFSDLFTQKESKWLLLTLLIMIPVTFIGRFIIKGSEAATSVGTLVAVVCFPLGLIPLFSGIGLIGLLPTLLLGVITGLLQAGMFNQDPLNGLIYASAMLAFVLAVDRLKHKATEVSNSVVLLASLVALAVSFLVILLNQFVSLLSVGMLNFQRLAENVFNLSISFAIAISIGCFAALAIKFYFPDEWTPTSYLKNRPSFDPVNFALTSIEQVSRGEFEVPSKQVRLSRDELRLSKAFERLQKQTQFSSEHQARLVDLDPATFAFKDLDSVLGAILKACLGKDSKSARIVIKDLQRGSDKPPLKKWLGEGELTRAYAYLDVMVLDKLGEEPQLVLSDLKIDQYFGLSADSPYPQSLIALNLSIDGQSVGMLWVGFVKTHWFTREELSFYEQLASRAEAALAVKPISNPVEIDRDQLLAAFDTIEDPVILLESDNSIYYLNKKAAQLAQENKELLRGSGERKVIGLPELQTLINDRSFQTRSPSIHFGTGKEFEVNVRPFKTHSEKTGKLLMLRDTSWIKKVNQQKSEFVTDISHDLRAPLNLMRGYVSLLENIGNLSEEQLKYISRIQGTIENMSRLVSKVMSLEQLDNEEALHYSVFEIKEIISEAVNMVTLPAQQRKVTINTDLSGLRVGYINADRVMMQQAMFNLLENAVKFSNRGGSVLVKASTDTDVLSIAIQDHGKGIAPLDQPKLFTRFFHVDDDDRIGNGGQGLGLAIVKSIATRHGGNVTVKSQLGEGSTFCLEIPLKR